MPVFTAVFAMVALAGCSSGSGGTKETKTCSLDMKPITMDITFNATDDKIETASIKVSMDYTSLGIEATELTAVRHQRRNWCRC